MPPQADHATRRLTPEEDSIPDADDDDLDDTLPSDLWFRGRRRSARPAVAGPTQRRCRRAGGRHGARVYFRAS